MIVYIAGRISGDDKARWKFEDAEMLLAEQGHTPISPIRLADAYPDLAYEQYMMIDFALVEMADAVYLLKDWRNSPGAVREHKHAKAIGKKIIEEDET